MMKITSIFENEGTIPKKYSCEGEEINPPLEIIDPPADTKSFCLILHDHDAPGGDFAHWIVWNIDKKVRKIMEGTTPAGAIEGLNDVDQIGYIGPCPPTGAHRYEFHFYALDTVIDLPLISKKQDLRSAIRDVIIEEASIVGIYQKEI